MATPRTPTSNTPTASLTSNMVLSMPAHLRPSRVWAKIWQIEIQPKPLADHIAIEKTTRSRFCPSYEVPLIRTGWPNGIANFVIRKAETHPQDWPFGAVPVRPLHTMVGMPDEIETERRRLTAVYGKARFNQAYPTAGNDDSFRRLMVKELLAPAMALKIRNEVMGMVQQRDELAAQYEDVFATIDPAANATRDQAALAALFGPLDIADVADLENL